jgi:hypothetical protein
MHAAEPEAEMAPMGLCQIFELMFSNVEGSGGNLVEQGFPDVGGFRVDEGNFGKAFAPESLA